MSLARIFIPSSTGPVTCAFRYWRTGAPWGGASDGIVKLAAPAGGCCCCWSDGCCDAARDVLLAFTIASGPAAVPLVVFVALRSGVGVLVRAPPAAGLGLGALLAGIGVCAGTAHTVSRALELAGWVPDLMVYVCGREGVRRKDIFAPSTQKPFPPPAIKRGDGAVGPEEGGLL